MIPAWNTEGVLPPVRPGVAGHHPDRSPYKASLDAFVDAMGTSETRLHIIKGLLAFRRAIHETGIQTGFQWLDGSFTENVETLESRDPRDVDVVTFFHVPEGETQASLVAKCPRLFDHAYVKHTYKVDSYWDVLGLPIREQSVRQICYWYSMWSHRRTGTWKGFVQVDLDASQDPFATQQLIQAQANFGVTP
ncbi:DUF6932 family protein [Pigmentiphaga litoralis]|uniref:Uncharacterized protein n=1 Tax=Pigmentiphaga litoralis TaxID=516702 RepID=A0A7Y9J033_9BURK|nr:hypothetical protein [Pigmentiphaga litoralis]NYE26539.1 hypothetical protein [Pigmentiphaga litoralis]NYE86050.1 hypothetical protein [Pigmentiphaga litoralis]